MRIAFFLNGFDNPHLVAKTPTIKCLDPDTPLHGRVTLTADPSEAVVQWTTAASKGGTVRWGTAPGKYAHSAEARDVTYTRDDMCGGAAKNVRSLKASLRGATWPVVKGTLRRWCTHGRAGQELPTVCPQASRLRTTIRDGIFS